MADHDERVPHVLDAARRGDARAMHGAYRVYAAGRGVPRSPGTALEWLRKSAAAGYALAQYDLATELGRASTEAGVWLAQAAEQGHPAALAALGWAYETGSHGLPRAPERALATYRRALAAGVATLAGTALAQRVRVLEAELRGGGSLATLVEAHGLARRKDAILALVLPSLRLLGEPRADGEIALGASKLGGEPDLPDSFAWPTADDGRPLTFLAQIDLGGCRGPGAPREPVALPAQGTLSVFYDLDALPFGAPGEASGWHVAVHPHAVPLARRKQRGRELTACALAPALESTLPPLRSRELRGVHLDATEARAYCDLRERLPLAGGERHRMLGHPDAVQGDMRRRIVYAHARVELDQPVPELEAECDHWHLLLQLDSARDMVFADDGRLFYWIRDDDLGAACFDRVRLQLQS